MDDAATDVPTDGGANLDFTKFAPVIATANPNNYTAGSAVELFYLMNIAHKSPPSATRPQATFRWTVMAKEGGRGHGRGLVDMFALAVNVLGKQNVTRTTATPFAPYVAGTPSGLRTDPHTSDMQMNPSVYSLLGTEQYQQVHKIGEVWASMLWDVYWNLVDMHGCGPIEMANLADGNALRLQLIMDGLKYQECNPNFVMVRDAILTSAFVLTGGVDYCSIWRGFAKRGLGTTALPACMWVRSQFRRSARRSQFSAGFLFCCTWP
ncbi:hypothetical protein AMAG_20183 [Allomyces macrogynus ATCC 38327]|uniref:Extracellular metalloproteinase n=1 Tax=Allomyces macrogynus (strain ATCC 38327) TaxID=578462 RepID=A0A0L0T7W5_ALLM3|nr:hypothetical protein AMAG_20183 [Allomyces macrogynus ATCC 38327]|eukprot:KNE70842.1 hypothetical protein AMAG_20183 [Allomyces macrogynus ATCC 38327]